MRIHSMRSKLIKILILAVSIVFLLVLAGCDTVKFVLHDKTIAVGEKVQLTWDKIDGVTKTEFRSSNDKIATVDDDGLVEGISAGTTRISATMEYTSPSLLHRLIEGGHAVESSCTVTVTAAKIEPNPLELHLNGPNPTGQLTATGVEGYEKDINGTWSIADTSIAQIDVSGLVTAKAAGRTVAVYKDANLGELKADVIVYDLGALAISPTPIELYPERAVSVGAVFPETYNGNKNGEWTVSDPNIAKVSTDGKIEYVNPGETTLTFTHTASGITAAAQVSCAYRVTFDASGGSDVEPNPAYILKGGKISRPDNPSREDHVFLGWQCSGENWDFANGIVQGDMTLVARWRLEEKDPAKTTYYTVRFDSNGGTDVSSKRVESGHRVSQPSCTRKGYTLAGWYTDADFEHRWSFISGVTRDMTLHAKWKEKTEKTEEFTVAFRPNGGSAVESLQVESGDKLDKPVCTRQGYTLEGWYTDSALTKKWDFNNPVNGDMTLYAKWVAPPVITSANAAAFTLGKSEVFTVTAKNAPSSFEVSGTLPSGVGFDAKTGTLFGTPVAGSEGVYALTFTARNQFGASPQQSFTLTVNEEINIGGETSISLSTGYSDTTKQYTVVGYPKPTVSLKDNTAKASISGAGVLTIPAGLPAGNYGVTIVANNAIETKEFKVFVSVKAPTLSLTGPDAASSTYGAGFEIGPYSVSGGSGPYTWTVSGPAELSLVFDTDKKIKGSLPPMPKVYSITLKVKDGNGNEAAKNITLTAT